MRSNRRTRAPRLSGASATRAALCALCTLCVASLAPPAQGLEVVRSARSLAHTPTRLAPALSAPQTALRPQGAEGSLAPRAQETALQSARGPATVLREAEVPRERLAQTRVLLAELQARTTPQQAIAVDLPADVLFDFDKADLRADATGPLHKAAELIKSYPTAPLQVLGHTDGKGTDAYNDALSLRRAQAVAHALQAHTGRQAGVQGLGKREPIAPNTTPEGRDDPEGRQRNRRVQILIGLPQQQPQQQERR